MARSSAGSPAPDGASTSSHTPTATSAPEPVTCPGCQGTTFTVEDCQCWYGGGGFEVDSKQSIVPDLPRRAYADCELCGGDGAVSRPCSTCQGIGTARPQVVLTVLNTDTAQAASTMLVPGGLPAPKMIPAGAWIVDLGSVIAELAERVGAGAVHDSFLGEDCLTRQPDGTYRAAEPEQWPLWLPRSWYPDLPPADLGALEAQALVNFGKHGRWKVWRAGSRQAPVADRPDSMLSALCALATALRVDLSIERRRDEPAVTGSPPGFLWDVRFEMPGGALPKSLPLPYSYLEGLGSVLSKLHTDTMLERLALDPSTAPGYWVTPEPDSAHHDSGSVASLEAELIRFCSGAAGAIATWRNQQWHLSPLAVTGTREDLHQAATGQVWRRTRTVVTRDEPAPPPGWAAGQIPETPCANCATGTAWSRCGCRLFDIAGTGDADCRICHGAGVYAAPHCLDCGDTRAIRRGAVVTITDGHRAIHTNWTADSSRDDIEIVGTQSNGTLIGKLPPLYSAGHLAALLGTTRARLVDLKRGLPLDSPLMEYPNWPKPFDGRVNVRSNLAGARMDYVVAASRGRTGARILLYAAPPPETTPTALIAAGLAAGSDVAVILRSHGFNVANPSAPQGDEWSIKLLAHGQPPTELAGLITPHRTLADAVIDADRTLATDLEDLGRAAGPSGLLAAPQQVTPVQVELDDLQRQLRHVAERYAGSRSEMVVARFSRAGCQLLLETSPNYGDAGTVMELEGFTLGMLAEAPTLGEAIAELPLGSDELQQLTGADPTPISDPERPDGGVAEASAPAPGIRTRNRGVIIADGREHHLESGDEDRYYALAIMRLRELGLVGAQAIPEIASHVETKVAMWMHEHQAPDVNLVLDSQPCVGPLSCHTVLSGQPPAYPTAPFGDLLVAYWRPEHADQPVTASNSVDLDRLLDQLAREPFHHSVAALYVATRPPNPAGLPDHELRLAVDTEAGLGALRYMDATGTWFSRGNTPSDHEQPCYSYMGSEALYPRDAHLPLPTICHAIHDFLERAGDRPASINWQPLTP
jgi:hypothetical protein